MVQRGSKSVIQLEEIAEGPVDVLYVHFFVDQRSFRHEHEAGVSRFRTSVEDVDSLQSHLFESGLIIADLSVSGCSDSRSLLSQGLDSEVQSISENVLVQPGGNVALGKDAKGSLSVVKGLELGVCVTDLITVLGPTVELRDVPVGRAWQEVLGSAAKQEVDTLPIGPASVSLVH